MSKEDNSYKTISEVVKILNLKSKKGVSLPTHTLRFWEKEFKQIKPKILAGNRRYYDKKNIELLKKIHFLLKVQGMTIKGVKKILNNKEPLKKDSPVIEEPKKKNNFFRSTYDELKLVVWPNKQQLFSESVAVIIMVSFSAAAIASVSRFYGWAASQIFG